jgi:Xaa-Pro aminopeptidase
MRSAATGRSGRARRWSSTPARSSTATAPTARAPSRLGPSRTSWAGLTRCLAGQQAGLDAARAGAAARDVDAAARDRIAADGFGEAFGHGLGHGVGLLGHEAPALRPESSDTLEAGNVVTIEPGIYLPGRGGIRIEDLVVVTADGPEVLTTFTKELLTVG